MGLVYLDATKQARTGSPMRGGSKKGRSSASIMRSGLDPTLLVCLEEVTKKPACSSHSASGIIARVKLITSCTPIWQAF